MNFPRHKCSLSLIHNEHRDYYMTVIAWLNDHNDIFSWENDEAKQRAIGTDEVWTLQWYPNTPISFHAIACPTLEELLDWAMRIEQEDG